MTSHDPLRGCRVLVADLPALLREIVAEELLTQPDMILAGTAEGPVDLLVKAAAGVDVVVMGARALFPPPPVCSQLFSLNPWLKLLILTISEGKAAGYWLGLQRRAFEPLTPSAVIENIRFLYDLDLTL